ncbi:molybdopterin-dependent oxidoreductase [Sphingobium sufflavum]|uniref:molybdopterin-dependent oxidoreductase n=1 Tax=Sphingobium sufflavum TaxID=1129547 RepID=UPI001F28A22F|nr:molybdopterin-dependent oxidoreductase [Sphingobium sufflavum]MCE7797652.1 molybdopterin-dependent oxidoreductase [Sphingobium sufflavum]
MSLLLSRRALIGSLAASMLAGCDRLADTADVREILFSAENFHKWSQRALGDRNALAPEFRADQLSPIFRANGTHDPATDEYRALWRGGFADWRLQVDGLVGRPLSLTLNQLRSMPHRTQITRHDCVEGWSAIGQWRGVPLATILHAARLSDRARYIVFHCADRMTATRPYYESIDLIDAFHPQTILAFALNDRLLSVPNGAPLRLRVERQLGYKQAKYLMRIQAVESLGNIHGGKGGYWEDVAVYEHYAGI